MQAIPLTAVPAQSLAVVLGGQNCQINLYSLQTPGAILAPTKVPLLDSNGQQIYDSYGNPMYTEDYSTTELQGYPALYADFSLNGAPVISCRIVRNLIPWLLDATYQGFVGDLVMVDTLSDTEPVWTGLGTQYQLAYLQPADLA
ncbi:MAG: hypothetical protein ACP5P4_05145 [Steroidobacteraceae bacterium]